MMKDDDTLPGVVFRLKQVNMREAPLTGKQFAQVVLETDTLNPFVISPHVWEEVVKKLSSFKVYAVDDFKTELLNALREENKRLEQVNQNIQVDLRKVLEENERMREALSVLHQQLTS